MGIVRWTGVLASVLTIAGCGGAVTGADAGSGEDAGQGGCSSACDDGVFCNGAERCESGSCVSGAARCSAAMVCDEANARCVDPMGCADDDGDGHTAVACGGDDCDDTDAARFPGNSETCDARGHDEDCDPSTLGGSDEDGDDHESVACCNAQPDGALLCGDDCDDDRGSVHPGVTDDCNLTDDDCDGVLDEDPATVFYRDLDGDGFGRPGDPDDTTIPEGERAVRACGGGPGFSPFDTDCDDAVRMINPAAPEVCADGVDNNCDAIQDADPTRPGFACACTTLGEERACGGGTSNVPPAICRDGVQSCQIGGTWSACIGDVAPQTERCNDVDDDCDGTVDEAVQITCYADPDNDGFAELGATGRSLCAIPGRESVGGCPILFTNLEPIDASTSDCAGSDASVRPGALDRCNLLDDDCDGAFDEGADDAGCTNTTAWGVCETGQCTVLACRYSRGDCDRVASNGCETELRTSSTHCGGCGNFCPLGATCRQGLCVDGFTSIAAGGSAACALAANGEVWCWGQNNNGQLGNGTTGTGSFPPSRVAASIEATSVSIGQSHGCAASSTGEVWCWGYNGLGAVGTSGFGAVPTPVLVAGVSGAAQVEVGADFSCARTSAGELWCWGSDTNGQLGNGAAAGGPTPSRVAVTGTVTDFALGERFGCALLDSGEVWCWGSETFGELGNGASGATISPARIAGFDAVDIEAEGFQACAIRSTGELWCWGRNEAGAPLGLATYGHRDVPVHIPGVVDVTEVSLSSRASCALQSDGTLACWSASGWLLEGASPTPRVITSLGAAAHVATGGEHGVYVLDDDGGIRHRAGTIASPFGAAEVRMGATTLSSGDAALVRARNGDTRYLSDRTLRGAVQIDTQSTSFCAVLASGQVACGVRGGGFPAPAVVSGISDAWEVSGGASFFCVLHQGGAVSCWGSNNERQLGVTAPTSSTTPIAVPGVSDAVEVVSGSAHTCARRSDGRVLCWGANDRGQLGTGSTAATGLPTVIASLDRVVGVSAGGDRACAILSSGEIRCWGGDLRTPVSVVGASSPDTLGGGGGSTQCALDRAGRVECWANPMISPVLVPGLYGVSQLDGGNSESCAIQAGAVMCWDGLSSTPAELPF